MAMIDAVENFFEVVTEVCNYPVKRKYVRCNVETDNYQPVSSMSS